MSWNTKKPVFRLGPSLGYILSRHLMRLDLQESLATAFIKNYMKSPGNFLSPSSLKDSLWCNCSESLNVVVFEAMSGSKGNN